MLGGLGALNKVGQAVAKSLPPSSASLYLDFTLGTLDSRITFTRGSQATLFDSAGTLVFAPNNVIRNNTMVGAAAGTPGTLPTNWAWSATTAGLTVEVIGTGVESGITYIDLKMSGTADGTAFTLGFEPSSIVTASSGQTWTLSTYSRIVGGSLSNIVYNLSITEQNGGSVLTSGAVAVTPTTDPLNSQRFSFTRTLTNASTNNIRPRPRFDTTAGAVDLTLRIGMPQLERGSVATAVNETSGTAYYGPRFDYDHSTLAAQGLLIEEARTNSIRNNTMQGAVAGTPGTLPTNWTGNATVDGLSREVVGTGTENGINYIDVRFSGTSGATGNSTLLTFESQTQVVAANGQTWTNSAYLKLAAGTLTNVSLFALGIRYNNSGGTSVTAQNATLTPTATLTRYTNTLAATDATTAFVNGSLVANFTDSSAVDFTVRIGLPQLELGAFATSVIPTTTTALTRNADVATMTGTNFSSWYNASEGTLFGFGASNLSASKVQFFAAVDTNTQNYISLARFSGATGGTSRTVDTNSIQADMALGTLTTLVPFKLATAYKVNDFASSTNGAAAVTDTAGTVPTVIRLSIGSLNGTLQINGYIQRIAYYPSRLPDTTLQALTA